MIACSEVWGKEKPQMDNSNVYLPLLANLADKWYVTGNAFTPKNLQLDDFRLFDLGVTDLDADNTLDLFTANHSARQSFLLNNGQGEFGENMLTPLGLDQMLLFPGLEDSSDVPAFTSPGLYVYWRDSILVFHAHQIMGIAPILGSATFYPEIEVNAGSSFDFNLTEQTLPNDEEVVTRLDFTVSGDGEMLVTPLPVPSVGSPIVFVFDTAVDLNNIFIGDAAIIPNDHTFQIQLKDRHGMAWHDYNNDGQLDVYMSRGGNRGLSDIYPVELTIDEFYLNGQPQFTPVDTTSLGFVKDGCAARQVGWVDYNNDNLLDLYIVCARGEPNQLYHQAVNGQFTNVAATAKLALRDDGHFAWLDVDDDRDMDMFWAGTGDYRIYVNELGTFIRNDIIQVDNRAQKITLADYDNDGDPDLFAASSTDSYLFQNQGGVLTAVAPESVGLPQSALTANWVDYDNDGLIDLHTIPDGLYQQTANHMFQATNLLQLQTVALTPKEARASWFDANGDGKRDAVASTFLEAANIDGSTTSEWFSGYFHNVVDTDNNWLTIKLIGRQGNTEAIGGTVVVKTEHGEYRQQVGWSEGARYSQGQYHLYFGLGVNDRVDQITVVWPDGTDQIIEDVSANQFLIVEQPLQ